MSDLNNFLSLQTNVTLMVHTHYTDHPSLWSKPNLGKKLKNNFFFFKQIASCGLLYFLYKCHD